jgi:hypothetical protein
MRQDNHLNGVMANRQSGIIPAIQRNERAAALSHILIYVGIACARTKIDNLTGSLGCVDRAALQAACRDAFIQEVEAHAGL